MGKAKAVILFSTFATEESATEIGRKLVERGLCACVSFTKVRSMYVWKGRVEDQSECLALFKVSKDLADPLKKELAKLHPYDVPEIVEIKMSDVSKPYLLWLNESSHSIPKKRNHSTKG